MPALYKNYKINSFKGALYYENRKIKFNKRLG